MILLKRRLNLSFRPSIFFCLFEFLGQFFLGYVNNWPSSGSFFANLFFSLDSSFDPKISQSGFGSCCFLWCNGLLIVCLIYHRSLVCRLDVRQVIRFIFCQRSEIWIYLIFKILIFRILVFSIQSFKFLIDSNFDFIWNFKSFVWNIETRGFFLIGHCGFVP